MSKRNFIENLYRENSSFESDRMAETLANLLDTVSSDIYSERQRFVFELIQNADDSACGNNNEVHFDFKKNNLIVSHNGKSFDENDILSLTSAGASTKKADATKIGYKGIGFKSIFGQSENVAIFSGGYQFRFDKLYHKKKLPWQIIPIWTDFDFYDFDIKKLLNESKYSVSTIIEIFDIDGLINDLREIFSDGKVLLFLRNISKISVSKNNINILSIEKITQNNTIEFDKITILENGLESSTWITKTFNDIKINTDTISALERDSKTPEKLKKAQFTEISFAALIEKGNIVPLSKENSLIFTYLPTKVKDFNFPFLVNSSFLTNASRENFHEDSIWNQWLFDLIANKSIEWLAELSSSEYKNQILKLLPDYFLNAPNKLKSSFNSALKLKIQDTPFVPTINSSLSKASDAIVDSVGLSKLEFISFSTIASFINEIENNKYSVNNIVIPDLLNINNLKTHGSYFITLESLDIFLKSTAFKKSHTILDNHLLIMYVFQVTKSNGNVLSEKVKELPFVFSEDNTLECPTSLCIPTIDFETEFGQKLALINKSVYSNIRSNKEIISWLFSLGVSEPSDKSFLDKEIIKKIDKCINEKNHISLLRYIFKLYKRGQINNEQLVKLHDLPILTKENNFVKARLCYLPDLYEPVLKLEKLNSIGNYVSEVYIDNDDLASEWKTLFIKIGVSERLKILDFSTVKENCLDLYEISSYYFSEGVSKARSMSNYNGYKIDNISGISKLTFIRNSMDYNFSKVFWSQVFTNFNPSHFKSNPRLEMGYWNGYCYLQDYNLWAFDNFQIFPAIKKTCHRKNELFLNNNEIKEIAGKYLPVLDFDQILSDEWKNYLQLKDKLELGDYLKVLEIITDNSTQVDYRKETINSFRPKIDLIYSKLVKILPDLTSIEKNNLKIWAHKNKLLSSDGTFEFPKDMLWTRIPEALHFSQPNYKLLYVNNNAYSHEYEELFSYFQVNIINDFVPSFQSAILDKTLKTKILKILPYIAAILEKKQFLNFDDEFRRIKYKLNNLVFYSSREIKLSFKGENVILESSIIYVYKTENKLYFKENWKNPVVMLRLIPELVTMFEIPGIIEELRVLLQIDETQSIEWLTELGYDISNILSKPICQIEQNANNISSNSQEIEKPIIEDGIGLTKKSSELGIMQQIFLPEISVNELELNSDESFLLSPKYSEILNEKSIHYEIEDANTRLAIGRWSEEFVNKYLSTCGNYTNIFWVNQNAESGSPYDFTAEKNGVFTYIEVKGTPSPSKEIIYLSSHEWDLMNEQEENYIILRVFNAGKKDARVEIIENPKKHIEKGLIQIALKI
jgi:hypothetical protein